jgi:hypothetical protein
MRRIIVEDLSIAANSGPMSSGGISAVTIVAVLPPNVERALPVPDPSDKHQTQMHATCIRVPIFIDHGEA